MCCWFGVFFLCFSCFCGLLFLCLFVAISGKSQIHRPHICSNSPLVWYCWVEWSADSKKETANLFRRLPFYMGCCGDCPKCPGYYLLRWLLLALITSAMLCVRALWGYVSSIRCMFDGIRYGGQSV